MNNDRLNKYLLVIFVICITGIHGIAEDKSFLNISPQLYANYNKDCSLITGDNKVSAIVKGADLVAGKFGKAVKVESGTQLIYNIENLFNKKSSTIAFWFKTLKGSRAKERMLFLSVGGDSYANRNGLILIKYDYGPKLMAAVMQNWKRSPFSTPGDAVWNADTWHHITYSRSAKENCCNLYLDGELIGSTYYSAWSGKSKKLVIGNLLANKQLTKNNSLNGVIDELRIYNYQLSDEQVQALYNYSPSNTKDTKK